MNPPPPQELLALVRTEGAAKYAREIGELVAGRVSSGGELRGLARLRPRFIAYREMLTYDSAGKVEGLVRNVPEAILELNEIFRFTTRFDLAEALLKEHVSRWPTAHPLTAHVPFVAGLEGPRDGFRDDFQRDVQIVSKPGAATTFLIFCGIRHTFGTHLNLLHHRCLAELNVNVIYLRDFPQALFLSGIASLGDVGQSCAALRRALGDLGSRRTVCLGNSGGVFGALYYASLLAADNVLLFSGPTSLEIGAEETERQTFARVNELHRAGKIPWPDIRSLYSQKPIPVSLYFGRRNRVDRLQAENLSALANVRLYPQPSGSHVLVDDLMASGELGRVFREMADEPARRRSRFIRLFPFATGGHRAPGR